jgi:hypothetical protein
MASRSKVTKRPKKKMNPELVNEIRQLEVLLKYSLRAVDGSSQELDKLFQGQADKIKGKLNKLKENQ